MFGCLDLFLDSADLFAESRWSGFTHHANCQVSQQGVIDRTINLTHVVGVDCSSREVRNRPQENLMGDEVRNGFSSLFGFQRPCLAVSTHRSTGSLFLGQMIVKTSKQMGPVSNS